MIGLIIFITYVICCGITSAIMTKTGIKDEGGFDGFPKKTAGVILWPIALVIWIGIWSQMLTLYLINNTKVTK